MHLLDEFVIEALLGRRARVDVVKALVRREDEALAAAARL